MGRYRNVQQTVLLEVMDAVEVVVKRTVKDELD